MDPFDLRQWPGLAKAGVDVSCPSIIDQVAVDSRRVDSDRALFVALQGTTDGHHHVAHAAAAGCRYAVVRKGWEPPDLPSSVQLLHVDDPLKAFHEIAATYRQALNTTVLAVTGSYGKTMVKDLLVNMLSRRYRTAASPESFNSQIGVPLSLFTLRKEHEIAIIEAAFSSPGEMRTLATMIVPAYGILTHVGKKHLSTMGSKEAIAAECVELLTAPTMRWALLPNDPVLSSFQSKINARAYVWDRPSEEMPHAVFLPMERGGRMPFQVHYPNNESFEGNIAGGYYYFLDLVNMAAKAAWLLGASSEQISNALHIDSPEPMRTEIWRSPMGATLINDSYCSDPQSVDVAMKHFELAPAVGRKIFLFHGIRSVKEKEASHYKRIGKTLRSAPVDEVVLVGGTAYAPLIEEVRQAAVSLRHFYSLPEAYAALRPTLSSRDTLLIKGESRQRLEQIAEALHESMANNLCVINLAAIESNLRAIRKKLSDSARLMVMIKAQAYGTDGPRMARFLASCGVDILGVAHIDEAVALRMEGVETSLFVINAAPFEAAKAVKWNLEVAVSSRALVDALQSEAARQERCLKVHLHVDTGMGRLGCRPEEALELARLIDTSTNLQLEGIMTHFASAEDPQEDSFTLRQVTLFADTVTALKNEGVTPPWVHAANSSAALRFDFPQFNMVRIGLATYGLYASEAVRSRIDLRLAFSLISRVVGINKCRKGETISYGRAYTVEKEEQTIAVLPVGYFDGLHRSYSGKGHVVIRGRKAPMVGRITMDYMMVDVTDIPDCAVGDSALLFGEDEYGYQVLPEDFALNVDSIPHELITCLGPRIQRLFVYEETVEKRTPLLGAHNERLPETA